MQGLLSAEGDGKLPTLSPSGKTYVVKALTGTREEIMPKLCGGLGYGPFSPNHRFLSSLFWSVSLL